MSAPVAKRRQDEGFALVALIVAIFLILLALSVAAPKVAMELKHEREIETAHRANQYVRAIREYYIQNGNQYPASMEQLEKTNNRRFLRQRYKDPMTGESNWRLILVGQNKTTVKGFFGQDLPGIAPGMGSAAGMGGGANLGSAAGSASAFGGPGSSGPGGTSGLGLGGSSSPTSSSPTGTTTATGTDSSGTTSSTGTSSGSGLSGSGLPSQSATDAKGIGGPFMGVGTARSGSAMLTVNQQAHYQDWEFLYDPRVELLKAQVSIFGGGGPPTGGSSNSIGGSTPGTAPGSSGFGSSTPGFGSSSGSSNSGFGSSSSGFGSSSGSGTSSTGTNPTSGTGTTGTTPP
ncbi:type II secretion system protein [Granulicella sp. WH15]|uniref:type II secretion system protein n=1 Tax=Granulicella sp. WH15 TaxID=2602070 RepID=UPI0013670C01|nr:type II secretion system protein [Granulicella sp. WH15]QHN02211.1 type II secretion system protein [Granulicella sp. WH15]